jgi:repressor LexA
VIVRQQPTFTNGEIGVAVIGGEATVKQLRQRGGRIELVPANESYDTIHVDPSQEDFRYAGKVVGVHRVL